jgi:hypothetical protein
MKYSPKAAVYRPVAESQDRREKKRKRWKQRVKRIMKNLRRQDKRSFFDRYVDKIKDF